MKPGEIILGSGDILLNADCPTASVKVANTGDRPVQVGSHYHFYEVNEALVFERETTLGYRLNIPSGTAIRFEPGQIREVDLVRFAGNQQIYGFNGKIMGGIKL